MRTLLLSFGTVVAIAAAALCGCDRLENPQSEYAALTDEVFRGGWVPKLLPPGATAIRTQHNIDTNEVWVRFKVGTAAFKPADLGFQQAAPDTWPSHVRRPRYASWWFTSLSQFPPGAAELYVGACRAPGATGPARSGHLLVVSGEAYLWCSGESAA